ncbi:hypothetical protein JW935_02585, partial [candidate division KSB1 bacterium]|nr:hypothetical protein [candidate division KSB1 bacterium]
IDGQGKIFEKQDWNDEGITRPHLIQFIQCQHVFIEGVTLRNSGCWMQHYLACDYLTIRGITVYNHCNYNNDMLDIDGCRYVTVSDCIGDSDDDALTFKSTSPRACENIVVTNCILSSHCNAIKMGTESTGGFKNITISNCVVRPSAVETNFFGKRRGLAGIALEIVDGGIMDGIAISDIRIEGTTAPVFMRLGNRARPYMQNIPKPGIGQMRNIKICDIIATGADTNGCAISGLPDFPIENVTLSNINIQFCGGGSADLVRTDIPENEAKYPESTMFGKLPAFGFFVRHVSGMTLNNLNLSFVDSDQRPALVFDDVKTLDVYGLKAQNPSSGQPLVLMNNVSDVYVTASRLGNADPAIKITGDSSRDIFIQGNREENLREKVQIEERMNNKP